MGKIIYSISTSLDGYVADSEGNFAWSKPSDEELAFINDTLRDVGIFLFGRSMYETMAVWDTIPSDGPNAGVNDFANLWRAAEKIAYSRTMTEVSSRNTTIDDNFEPEKVHALKLGSDKDLNIAGPHLAAEAIKAGLIDEYHQFIVPIILGGGNHWLPRNVRSNLELIDVTRFKNGFVHLQYKPV